MNVHELVDELYEAFADRIGEPWSTTARELPWALRLAPAPVPWSRVFSHEVTLGAPALIAEGLSGVRNSAIRDAVLAHALAVIDAFGTDRIEDEQIIASPGVLAVLGQVRRERDRAIVRLFGQPPPPEFDYAATDALTVRAIRRERTFLECQRPVDLRSYERVSLDKQCAGVVASIALANIGGWRDRRWNATRAMLESVWLGLQLTDDVVDWEDDLRRGGAWAVCLMNGMDVPPSPSEHSAHPARVRTRVLKSGVLHLMLGRARMHMRAASRRASALGAVRLANWAARFEERLQNLAKAEASTPGYAVRANALAAWAAEVLA